MKLGFNSNSLKVLGARTVLFSTFVSLAACSNSGNKTPPESVGAGSGVVALSSVSDLNSDNTGPLVEQPQDFLATSAYNNPVLLDPAGSTIISNQTKFSSASFGVKGSPRVETGLSVRKGGGRYHVGKPYTIRGIRYVPKVDPDYRARGHASWYGPNFHGRLTANGEVYDQFALSGAHPTMPLPSYAKVTNLENGASVVVRINDRGPFSKGRIIDLSSQAAHMLGYTQKGIAKVEVEYVGKAQLDGLDSEKLMASYNPGTLSMPSGAEILAANNAAIARQKLALAAPQQQARKPLSSFGTGIFGGGNKSASTSVLPPPQPLALISGYQDAENGNLATAAIEDLLSSVAIAPVDGMDSLERLEVTDIQSRSELNALMGKLSTYGPVSLMRDEMPYAILAIVPKEDIFRARKILPN